MAVKNDNTLITKGDLKKFYNKILPYMGGNYVFNTLGTKDYYSEDEKVIGVWTDGKPLYRKVYDITTPSSANTNTVLFNIGSEIEVKNMYGHIISPGGGVRPVPWNYSGAAIIIFVDPGVFYMNVNDNINVKGRPGQIVLEYTKSTDAANSAVDTIGCYDITRPDLWPVEKEITFGNGLYGYRYQQASGGSNVTIPIKSGYNPNTFKFINQGGTLIRALDNAPHCNPSYGGPFWWVQGNGTLSIYTYGGASASGGAWKNLDMWCLYTK